MTGLATLLQSSSLNYLKPHRQELLHLLDLHVLDVSRQEELVEGMLAWWTESLTWWPLVLWFAKSKLYYLCSFLLVFTY